MFMKYVYEEIALDLRRYHHVDRYTSVKDKLGALFNEYSID